MKRYAKYLIGPAVIAVVAVLVMVNRNSVQEDIDRASAKQLTVVLDGVEQIYEYSEEDPAYVEFDAQMRKKNGDVYDNHYAGMPLSTILESMDAAVQEDSAVTVTYADQYEIQLTDAMLVLARRDGMIGVDYTGTRYDMGNKLGILQAAVEVGLKHPEVGEDFRKYLKKLAETL